MTLSSLIALISYYRSQGFFAGKTSRNNMSIRWDEAVAAVAVSGACSVGPRCLKYADNYRPFPMHAEKLICSAPCLIGEVILETHLPDLLTLHFCPIHMILFHLENAGQQVNTSLVPHFVRQGYGIIVSMHG